MTTFKTLFERLVKAIEEIARSIDKTVSTVREVADIYYIHQNDMLEHYKVFDKFLTEEFPGIVEVYKKHMECLTNYYKSISDSVVTNKDMCGGCFDVKKLLEELDKNLNKPSDNRTNPMYIPTGVNTIGTEMVNGKGEFYIAPRVKEESCTLQTAVPSETIDGSQTILTGISGEGTTTDSSTKPRRRGRPVKRADERKAKTVLSAEDAKKTAMNAKVGLEAFTGYSKEAPVGRRSYIEVTDGITGEKGYYKNLSVLQSANNLSFADYQRINYAMKNGKAVNGVFVDKIFA